MSKDSDKSEPSMDDILASIRRIIDEDGSKTRKGPPPPAAAKSGGDVLELTEMVNDDGSVTSLQHGAVSPAMRTDDDEPPIYADHSERSEPPRAFGAADSERPTLAGDPPPRQPAPPPERPMPQGAPQPQTAPPAAAQPSSQPPAPPRQQPSPQPTQSTQAPRMQPSVAGSQFSLTPVSANATSTQPAAAKPPAQAGMVSGQTASAASAAFDRLAQAALQQQTPPPPPPAPPRAPSPTVGGRALEDIVGEMLRPMLSQWLDANLPAIVERLVQQEIQKMSKR